MTRRDALVGYTGLVGGNLLAARDFDLLVNSKNPEALTGDLGRVVLSAAKAEKWRANQDPEGDSAHVAELERMLAGFTCEELVVVSTVDVFADPRGVDEATPVETDGLHAYGLHRYRLEETARRLHDRVVVLRLPGLFGPGLKKNVVHDLLHGHRVEHIQPESEFQYYDLRRLADDVDTALAAGLQTVHLVTEPVRTAEVMRDVFGVEPAPNDGPVVRYDLRTRYAGVFGGSGRYVADRAEVLAGLRSFLGERAAA